WITWRNWLHIVISHTIFHSLVNTNSSSTSTSSCFTTCFNYFPSTFSNHRCTSTSHFRTSISSHHRLPSCTKSSIYSHCSLYNVWSINKCPRPSNQQDNYSNNTDFLL